ncbi:MAG: DcaP family trimeric outer membrane transporter [Calditrichia bacterium]
MHYKDVLRLICGVCLLWAGVLWAEESPKTVLSNYETHFYGFVRWEAMYDNTEVAKGDWYLFAYPDGTPQSEQDEFLMTVRHTRLGMKISGPELDSGAKINALVEMDFAGGYANSSTAARQPKPRLRHAWVEVAYPTWSLRFGQDWALISGPFPTTQEFVVGAGKGNLWMRYPQVKFTTQLGKKGKFAFSLNRPMAGNIKYDAVANGDLDFIGDGERTGLPWVMARLWWNIKPLALSIGGHYGQEQITVSDSKTEDKVSYSIVGDVTAKAGKAKLVVRGFYGENLNSFLGGIFQGYVIVGDKAENIKSQGGWANLVYSLSKKWQISTGAGMDDPDDEFLSAGKRIKNSWVWSDLIYFPHPALKFALEVSHLSTEYKDAATGKNWRYQILTQFTF